jgi:hypothetical protein
MATSKPGYGAIPPLTMGQINNNISLGGGSSGQFLTANGLNGTNWVNQNNTTAIQIGNPDPVITFKLDGDIITKAGTISAHDWISVHKVMKRLIMDMSNDQELVSKYPYIQEAAHTWLMEELKK